MLSTLSHLSESSKLFIKKNPALTGTVIALFSTLRFYVKHGRSVTVIARQQTYCAINLEQGGGEVPAPSILRKAKLWNDSKNAGETLEMILA